MGKTTVAETTKHIDVVLVGHVLMTGNLDSVVRPFYEKVSAWLKNRHNAKHWKADPSKVHKHHKSRDKWQPNLNAHSLLKWVDSVHWSHEESCKALVSLHATAHKRLN